MRFFAIIVACFLLVAGPAVTHAAAAKAKTLAEQVAGLETLPGFLDLYVDKDAAKVLTAWE